MQTARSRRPCGRPECSCSTSIGDFLTFGRGHLDRYGHWEIPCRLCAEEFDRNLPNTREEIRTRLADEGRSQAYIDSIMDDVWLNHPAWPFDEESPALRMNQPVLAAV